MPFRAGVADRWFGDYVPGVSYDCGSFVLTEDDIIRFAAEFDPMPFHVDREAAQASGFGGLVASGAHALSLMTRQLVEHYHAPQATIGGLGIDNLRIRKPIRPHVEFRVSATVLEARVSRSKPDRGFLRTLAELTDESGDAAFHAELLQIMAVRPKR